MQKQHESYPDQFTEADLTEAYSYLKFCLSHELVIDFDALNPQLAADLCILKVMMLSQY